MPQIASRLASWQFSELVHIDPEDLHDPTSGGYTHVLVVPLEGRTIHVSGRGADHRGGGLSLDFAAQLDEALANMGTALQIFLGGHEAEGGKLK